MKYDQTEEFSDEQFRRLTGVKRSTFKKMIEILREADHKKKTRGGRKSKLSLENRLLIDASETPIERPKKKSGRRKG